MTGARAAEGRAAFPVLAFVLATLFGLLSFLYNHLDDLASGASTPWVVPFVEEMSGYYGGALLIPAVVWMARRFPPALTPRMAAHLGALLLLSALLTSWNWGARTLLFQVLGLGSYQYGWMPARFAMELPKGASAYLLGIVFVTLLDRYRAAREHEIRVAQVEASLARARLDALSAQLQPHFLFNTLNAISSIMYQDVRAADRMLSDLSELLRFSLRASGSPLIPVSQEIGLLSRYVELMRARFGDRLQVEITAADELLDAPIPPMILQPLVENALTHGAPPPPEPARVRVRIAPHGDAAMSVEVEDRGPGFDPRRGGAGHGVGLGNTRERLRTLYGDGERVEVASAVPSGTVLRLTIPLRARVEAA